MSSLLALLLIAASPFSSTTPASGISVSSPIVLTGGTLSCALCVTGLGAVGSTPNANGASILTGTLTLQPADGTNPGLLTAGAQTIGGAKTFSSSVTSSSYVQALDQANGFVLNGTAVLACISANCPQGLIMNSPNTNYGAGATALTVNNAGATLTQGYLLALQNHGATVANVDWNGSFNSLTPYANGNTYLTDGAGGANIGVDNGFGIWTSPGRNIYITGGARGSPSTLVLLRGAGSAEVNVGGTSGQVGITGYLSVSSTQNRGQITMAAGTGTATVNSGAFCVCSDTQGVLACQPSVSGTTLTVTVTGGGTNIVNYICFN